MKGKTGKWVPCEVCGKLSYKTCTNLKRSKHYFCSQECARQYRHEQAYEIRKCEFCGAEMELSKKSPKRFCSNKCQNEWQKTRVGPLNPKFTGKLYTCDYCGKEYWDQDCKKKNQYHFCSATCRKGWHKNVFSQNPEWKEESRIRAAKILSDGVISHTMTKPQIAINNILDDMGITYINEYNIKYYAVDNYLNEYNLCIEVMGDFWHCNPINYSTIKYVRQRQTIRRDKAKNTYLLKYYNINTLYLWETDINSQPDLCCKLIEAYVKYKGMLTNYHSFNYELINGVLCVKHDCVKPYQNMTPSELEEYMQLTA